MLVLIGGCSYSSDIVVWNQSPAAITITVTLRYELMGVGDRTYPSLGTRPKGPFAPIDPSKMVLDASRRELSVDILPGEALRVAKLSGYFGPSLDEVNTFPVTALAISRPRAEKLVFTNERALLAFEEWNDRLFVYTAR